MFPRALTPLYSTGFVSAGDAVDRRPPCSERDHLDRHRPAHLLYGRLRRTGRDEAFMPISTRATKLFGVEHPIVLAPMDNVAGGELAAAVTRAGVLGMIGGAHMGTAPNRRPCAHLTPDRRSAGVREAQQFGVQMTAHDLQRDAVVGFDGNCPDGRADCSHP
jgi:Nitronate monooxygenase